jgi:hypothetical protein
MVFAHTYVLAGIVNGSPLADQNIACFYGLTAELLKT